MDRRTKVHDLKEKVRRFCEARGWDRFHGPKDLAIGVITEASELLEHFRFKTDRESEALLRDPKTRRAVCDELVDVMHTILRFAQKYGIDLTTELHRKMSENEKKYPLNGKKGRKKR